MRREGWLAAMGLAVALVAGVLVDAATAGIKPHLSARINGRVLKAGGRRLQAVNLPTVFGISASTKNVRFNRAVAFDCVVFDLAAIESFDGTRARGTFSGAFDFSANGNPAAAIKNGKFDAVITSTGGG